MFWTIFRVDLNTTPPHKKIGKISLIKKNAKEKEKKPPKTHNKNFEKTAKTHKKTVKKNIAKKHRNNLEKTQKHTKINLQKNLEKKI